MEVEEVCISDRNKLLRTSLLEKRISAVCFLRCIVKDTKKLKRGSGFYAKVVVNGATFYGIFTNNHVVSNETEAWKWEVIFDYDKPGKGKKMKMRPDLIFCTSKELDYTFIGVNKDEVDNLSLGLEPIELKQEPPVSKGDEIFIFQHPSGRPKEFSHEEVISVERPFVYYRADTEGGSSGSPVLRNLELLAIHHKGREGEYNKGTLCSEIIQHMDNGAYTKTTALFPESQDKEALEGEPKVKKLKVERDPDSTPTEEELEDLAQECIPFYKPLGRKLGIPNSKIQEISMDHLNNGTIREKAVQVLLEWVDKQSAEATHGALSKALRALGKERLAQEFCS